MSGTMRAAWWLGVLLAFFALALPVQAQETLRIEQWVDTSGRLSAQEVAQRDAQFQPVERPKAVALGSGALWLRVDVPPLASDRPWYLMLNGAAFLNRASLFTRGDDGAWREQHAGDHVPVARWSHPNFAPVFQLPDGGATTAWLRIENRPAPASAHLVLLDADELQQRRHWTYLAMGAYVGFGLLVVLLALMHARLYADQAFDSYAAYVACMLLFQLAFTGVGAVFFWPGSARFNDAAPALFMLWMTAAGIWNIRKATALTRHGPRLARAVLGFSIFGLLFPLPYLLMNNAVAYAILNVYGLAAVALSISLCLWTWRRGEAYSLWLFFGFLPVHLAYPFPALRAAGVLPDSWATQYAVLIGSAIEIPLLLYILHRRARDFGEHRARLRALESTDPLTGLVLPPVLHLRLRDGLRRGRRMGHRCTVLLVELANHPQIAGRDGREVADRALVVTASRLARVVRDIDTVCRVSDTRFAILVEGPSQEDDRRRLAQHMVARGLERARTLPPDTELRLRVVSALAPDGDVELAEDLQLDEHQLLQRLHRALDRLMAEPRRVIQHLEPRVAAPSGPGSGEPSSA